MKGFYIIFSIVAGIGLLTLKGYNAMGCAYISCMCLFCLMISYIAELVIERHREFNEPEVYDIDTDSTSN
jgi:hypothetical protein